MPFHFDNLPEADEQLPVPVYLLRGTSSGAKDGIIAAMCDHFPTQYYEVVDGHFKCYLHLNEGENHLVLRHREGKAQNGRLIPGETVYEETRVALYVETPIMDYFEVPTVHLCLLLGSDSSGTFDCPEKALRGGNNVDSAVRRMRVAGRLMQTHMLDEMRTAGLGNRCFQFEEEEVESTLSRRDSKDHTVRWQPKVHVIRSSKYTVEQIRSLDWAQQNDAASEQDKLIDVALESVSETFGDTDKTPVYALVVLMDTHWDKEAKMIRGHACCGREYGPIRLTLFGSHGLHTWPDCYEAVFRSLTNPNALSTEEVANDGGRCGTFWECFSTTLACTYMFLGYSLGAMRDNEGLTMPDFSLNRKFVSRERRSLEKKTSVWGPVLDEFAPGWGRENEVRFLFHPAFSLVEDFEDAAFKPDELMQNQGLQFPDSVNATPQFVAVDTETLQIKSSTGIYLIECYIGLYSRLHFEMLPAKYGSLGPQRLVNITYKQLQEALDEEWRDKPLKLRVSTLGLGVGEIKDLKNFLDVSGITVKVSDGRTVHLSSLFGEYDGSRIEALIPAEKRIASIRVNSDWALRGIQLCFTDDTVSTFGDVSSVKDEIEFEEGEILVGFRLHVGAWVDGIAFVTNKRTTANYGGTGGHVSEFSVPEGAQFVGFYGEQKDWIYKIGGYYR